MRRLRCSYYDDCKERIFPEDPEASGHRQRALCDGCYSFHEALVQPIKEESEWVGKQWDVVTQLRSEVQGWRKKHAETLLALDKLNKKPESKWD